MKKFFLVFLSLAMLLLAACADNLKNDIYDNSSLAQSVLNDNIVDAEISTDTQTSSVDRDTVQTDRQESDLIDTSSSDINQETQNEQNTSGETENTSSKTDSDEGNTSSLESEISKPSQPIDSDEEYEGEIDW